MKINQDSPAYEVAKFVFCLFSAMCVLGGFFVFVAGMVSLLNRMFGL